MFKRKYFIAFVAIIASVLGISLFSYSQVSASTTSPFWDAGTSGGGYQNIYFDNGYVGIATGTQPGAPLEVKRTSSGDAFRVSGNGGYFLYASANSAGDGRSYIGALDSSLSERDLILNRFGSGISGNGKVGIGRTDPQYLLDVKGPVRGDDTRSVSLRRNIVIGNDAFIADIDVANAVTLNGQSDANIGKLRLGNTGPMMTGSAGKLYVEGEVRAQTLKVQTNVWADYVFEDDYQLMTLEEVEAYIKEHGHLPGVPSAREVEGTSMDVAETNRILLEKIEELTLYSIEQEKRLNSLEERLNKLESNQ